jgi:hypothetical protein
MNLMNFFKKLLTCQKKDVFFVPKFKKERTGCPFYGFTRIGAVSRGSLGAQEKINYNVSVVFMDQGGNECAISKEPCPYSNPSWNECCSSGDNKLTIEMARIFLDKVCPNEVFFPKEFEKPILESLWFFYIFFPDKCLEGIPSRVTYDMRESLLNKLISP